MAMATGILWILLLVLVALMAGGVVLQVYLSRMEKGWPGLCLPGLCFLGSLAPLFQLSAVGSPWELTRTAFAVLLLGNIPTLVLLAIWLFCRRGRRRRSQMRKMKIDELE